MENLKNNYLDINNFKKILYNINTHNKNINIKKLNNNVN